jgi:hypothetical protein
MCLLIHLSRDSCKFVLKDECRTVLHPGCSGLGPSPEGVCRSPFIPSGLLILRDGYDDRTSPDTHFRKRRLCLSFQPTWSIYQHEKTQGCRPADPLQPHRRIAGKVTQEPKGYGTTASSMILHQHVRETPSEDQALELVGLS